MSDFTTTFDNESFINSEISNNENIKSSLNAEEVIENSLDVVEETTSELNSQSGMNSLLDEPMVHRYNGEDSDNIEVHVDNEKYKVSATLKKIRFKTSNDFPEVGSEKLIYIANDTKEIFGWDDSNGYFKIKVGETYDDSEIREEIDLLKENKVDNAELDKYYTKSQVDDILASGSVDVDLSGYYKKSETYSQQEVNGLLNNKANKSELSAVDTRVSELEKDNATNKTNINNLGNTKADKKDVIELQNNKADKSEIPFVGNFITKAVNDLVNYYTKEETYTQVEVRQLVSAIPKFSVEVVTGFPTNPSETTIYLLKTSETETRNLYTEYIFVNGIWEKLGTQTLDLSGYVTTEALNSELAKYYTIKSVDALLSYKADKTELPYVGDFIKKDVDNLTNYYKKAETYTKEETANLLNGALANKADKSELESLATKEELNSYAKKDEVLTEDDLKDYATETQLNTSISDLNNNLVAEINKKADASALEGLEESINQVSNNVTGISQKYVQDAVVSDDGKTLQIVKKVGNEIKNVYFQGGGADSGVGLPIGSIFPSAIPQTDARVHLLDGSTISQTGVYADFANLIKNLVSSGYNISCSETEFNNDVTSTGNCGKFVINNTNGTIRLPKITRFIQGLSDITNIGKSLGAGLPNITGQISRSDGYPLINIVKSQSGALLPINATTNYSNQTQSGSAERPQGISFDASKSSSIYGNSTTVQPQSTQYPYYIVLASGYKSTEVVNFDNILSELNNKQDKINAGNGISIVDGVISSNIPYLETHFSSSSDQSVTGSSSSASSKTIKTVTKSLPKGMYLCYLSGVIKTSSYTGDLVFGINGTDIGSTMITNTSNYAGVSLVSMHSFAGGNCTVNIKIRSRATVTMCAYSTCNFYMIRVGD